MRLHFVTILAVYCIVTASCSSLIKKPTKAYIKANPPTPIKIDGLLATPRYSTHIYALLNTGPDTLGISVNSTQFYYPFGLIKSKPKPNLGVLRNFGITNKIIQTAIGNIDIQILKHRSSKLIFFFNTVNGDKHADILKGEVYDTDVKFINSIIIGMSVDDFYKCFFDHFPLELENRYKFFELESADEIKHIYSFENNKLKVVKFSSNRAFVAAY